VPFGGYREIFEEEMTEDRLEMQADLTKRSTLCVVRSFAVSSLSPTANSSS